MILDLGRFHHKGATSKKVFVGCASRTGSSRNISRKDAKTQSNENQDGEKRFHRRDTEFAEVGDILINELFFGVLRVSAVNHPKPS
jgi:hypothetical protein